jgi:hypothetical protein
MIWWTSQSQLHLVLSSYASPFLEAVSSECVLSLECHFFMHPSQLIKEKEALLMRSE